MNRLRQLCFSLFLLPLFICSVTRAQQPFLTDDSDTTPRKHFHFEFSNEFDSLNRSAFPSLRQNTADFELDYGLLDRVEIGVESPLLTIFNARGTVPETPTGIGDTNISMKYNFVRESEHSRMPAFAIALNLELPTGNTERGLGSGLADFYLNGIVQKSLTKRTKLRVNSGILFSGNTTTGAVGIKARGRVFTEMASIVRQFNSKFQAGVELAGAITNKTELGKKQLQGMIGGNYQFKPNTSFDFGLVFGKDTSPRVGIQLGVSIDF
jgi:hypothetical protein